MWVSSRGMTSPRLLLSSLLAASLLLPACDGGGARKDGASATANKDAGEADEGAETRAKPAAEGETEPEQVEPAKAVTLKLAEAKLWEEGKEDRMIKIAADGTITVEGAEGGGKVTADGKLQNEDGVVFAQLKADGSISLKGVDSLPLNIDESGVVEANGKKMSVGEDGSIVTDPVDEKVKMKTEGCTGDMARTCMFAMMGVMMAVLEPVDGPAGAPAAE